MDAPILTAHSWTVLDHLKEKIHRYITVRGEASAGQVQSNTDYQNFGGFESAVRKMLPQFAKVGERRIATGDALPSEPLGSDPTRRSLASQAAFEKWLDHLRNTHDSGRIYTVYTQLDPKLLPQVDGFHAIASLASDHGDEAGARRARQSMMALFDDPSSWLPLSIVVKRRVAEDQFLGWTIGLVYGKAQSMEAQVTLDEWPPVG